MMQRRPIIAQLKVKITLTLILSRIQKFYKPVTRQIQRLHVPTNISYQEPIALLILEMANQHYTSTVDQLIHQM